VPLISVALEGWDMDIDELEWYTGRWNAAVQRREARLEAEGGLTVTTTYADNKFLDKMEGKWSEAAAREMGTGIIGEVPRCSLVQDAEAEGKTVLEKFPSSEMSGIYRSLAGLLAGRRAAA
jgi:nitrogenase subunit NifH